MEKIQTAANDAAEKRAALDLWSSHVTVVLAQATGANVTALRPKRA